VFWQGVVGAPLATAHDACSTGTSGHLTPALRSYRYVGVKCPDLPVRRPVAMQFSDRRPKPWIKRAVHPRIHNPGAERSPAIQLGY